MKNDTSNLPAVALEVEIQNRRCIAFATTKRKAQYIATKAYWEAYGRRRGEWPRAAASRRECFDNHPFKNNADRKCWNEQDL